MNRTLTPFVLSEPRSGESKDGTAGAPFDFGLAAARLALRSGRAVVLLLALATPVLADTTAPDPAASKPAVGTPPEPALERVLKPARTEGGPRALAVSPDGKRLAVGQADGKVALAELAVESNESAWPHVIDHGAAVSGLAFLAKGERTVLASAGDDGCLRVVTLASDAAVIASASRALGLGPLTALVALDADRVAVASVRGGVAVVKISDALQVERTFERHDGAVVALAALPKNRVASAGADGFVKVSDAATGKEQKAAKVSPVELTSLAATPDGKALVAGSWRKPVALLDAGSLKPLGAAVEPHRGGVTALALLGGPTLASCCLVTASIADECVAVSEPLGAKLDARAALRKRIRVVPSALALSPDATRLFVAGHDGSIDIYKLEVTR